MRGSEGAAEKENAPADSDPRGRLYGLNCLRGEDPVAQRRVADRVECDQLALVVIGEDIGVLVRLALERDRGQDDHLVAVGDEIVRLGC